MSTAKEMRYYGGRKFEDALFLWRLKLKVALVPSDMTRLLCISAAAVGKVKGKLVA